MFFREIIGNYCEKIQNTVAKSWVFKF